MFGTNTNTLFIGKVLLAFEELPSTNQFALELLTKSKPSEGTAISTANQVLGRGQLGSTWLSSPGENLTLSIILYPTFIVPRAHFVLNQAVALAVRQLVATALPQQRVQIKWPNDILIEGKKTAGILIQNAVTHNRIQSSVIGIGLNVNQAEFPADLPQATSLRQWHPESFSLELLRDHLFVFLEHYYLQLRAGQTTQIQADYLQHLYRFGKRATYGRPDNEIPFQGTIRGIEPDGRLRVEHEQDHRVELFDLKEIRFI